MSRSTLRKRSEQLSQGDVKQGGASPIKDRAAERTRGARTPKEVVPDSIRESLRLAVGLEADAGASTTEREGQDLPFTLTSLDVTSKRLAIGETSPRERCVILRVTDLGDNRQSVRVPKESTSLRWAYVREVQNRCVAGTEELVDERNRDHVDCIVLCGGQVRILQLKARPWVCSPDSSTTTSSDSSQRRCGWHRRSSDPSTWGRQYDYYMDQTSRRMYIRTPRPIRRTRDQRESDRLGISK